MYIYILERFFRDENSALKDDYRAVCGLFKKIATDNSLDFYEIHRRVEELYFSIHENHDLEQYFGYEGIEILSEKLPDIDPKNIRYQYVGFKDIEEKKTYKNLKKFYEHIVDTYMSVLNHRADYTEELTEPEKRFIECIFNFSYYNKYMIEKLKNDRWELVHIDERKEIVECMQSMCDLDINTLNKYIGANTTQEFEQRFEDVKLKILNPVTYRIFNAVEDIKAELPVEKSFQKRICDDPDGDDAHMLKMLETKLEFVKNQLIEINKKEDDSLCNYIDISRLL
jgi:hypothetical protein